MKKAILALIVFAVLLGCETLVIEKKSLLVSVSSEVDEVHVYYVLEGISLRDKNKWAKSDLDALRKTKFSFFPAEAEGPLLKLCEFEDLRFFVDPARKRQLCADRSMTIRNRTEFSRIVNQSVLENMETLFTQLGFDEQAIKDEIKRAHVEIVKNRPGIEFWLGSTPFLQFAEGLLEILEEFDDESIRRIIDAAKGDFNWFRFEAESVQLVFPATVECATRIVADPCCIECLKTMQASISPIELQILDDGLAIVLGAKERVTRLSYTDDRQHDKKGDSRIAQLAGDPKPIIVNGNTETADSLVARFTLEKTGFRTWNDATGNFALTAKFGGIVGGKVVLLKADGSKAYVAREQLGLSDQDYVDAVAK